MYPRTILALALVALGGCSATPVYEGVFGPPSCGGGYIVPQYRVALFTYIGNLTIEVKDEQGRPVHRAKIGIRPISVRSILCGTPPYLPTNESGILSLERVKTGTYRITYFKTLPNDGQSLNEIHKELEVEVRPNETTVVNLTKPAS